MTIDKNFHFPVFRAGMYSEFDLDFSEIIGAGETVIAVLVPDDEADFTGSSTGVLFGVEVNDTFDKFQGTPPEDSEGEYFFSLIVQTDAPESYTFSMGVKVLPKLEAEDTEDPSQIAEFLFPSAYCISEITTDKTTHAVNQSGSTLDELASRLNIYFAGIEKLYQAQVTDGDLRIKTNDGTVIESAKDCEETAIPVSSIQDPESVVASAGRYFGKDDPDDEEYSYYTLINTNVC